MKKILTLVLVSALGGILTLGAYKLFIQEDKTLVVDTVKEQPALIPTVASNTVYKPYETPDFTKAAENTVNAVVHVKNVTISRGQMTFEDLFLGRSPQRAQLGTGSGVIITPDGYIITNNHVVDKSQELSVTLNNNKTYKAEIVGTDPKTDIALLKIEADEELPVVTFGDSDSAKIGEWVLAVGNPFNLTSTVTAGIISAKARDLSGNPNAIQSFIQTDAAVNPGNSGGALVNTNGELIGINTAISSQTGSYVGYSFAVPSNIARKVVNDIMEYGNVQNGILGVSGVALNSRAAEEIEIDDTQGFYVGGVEEDSGAAEAGIKEGDIIKEIDNVQILKFADLKGHLNTKGPGDIVNVKFSRDGNIKTVPVRLVKNMTANLPLVGQIKNAKPDDLKKYKAKNGVKIVRLNDYYKEYWNKNGIKEGSIITAVNDIEVNNVDDVQNILKNKSTNEPLRIELINENGEKERYNFR
ncbi:trypsin-like peptidase domain-containing protein [Jejuia pallidilutea]|uniref:Do/DeqQ family serine protease n=2 Tax=Jejuia pallidilutea TaxID=504487 RepID=A0A090WYE1_9FLAO|nr:trypsin-like peptidase domain-containing protein [Jejuia pallidilutea]PQV50521.1 Do/DeqQ family serine protease [Jejuia pallidilutea]GAL72392.1 HtrA protease [Jejuia pallidilutea]GAL88624.1 HtrA protease/chaperone protein [Jejuia pallidilutea]